VEAIKTKREKQQQTEVVPVEDSFPEREPAPLDWVDDPMVVPSNEEDWVVKLEQSVNIFLTVIQVPELSPPILISAISDGMFPLLLSVLRLGL
jgi:hypothetical protein